MPGCSSRTTRTARTAAVWINSITEVTQWKWKMTAIYQRVYILNEHKIPIILLTMHLMYCSPVYCRNSRNSLSKQNNKIKSNNNKKSKINCYVLCVQSFEFFSSWSWILTPATRNAMLILGVPQTLHLIFTYQKCHCHFAENVLNQL